MAKPKPNPRLPPIKVKPSGGITAWHASPHLFDAFDSRRIGTGEGAQAYGHGLYFAGRRPTSEWYYNKFADQHPYYGRPEDELRIGEGGTVAQRRSFADDLTGADEMALDIIESASEGSAKHRDPVRLKQDAIDELARRRGISDDDRKSVHASLIKLLAQGAQWPPRDAHLYKVNIDADPESFLDWNRVASVQPPQVKQALSDLGWFSKGQLHRVLHPQSPEWYARTGKWLYHNLLEKADQRLSGAIPPRSIGDADRMAKELVATELVASGVPGIRYLDGMSRSGRNRGLPNGARTPPGTNYVMFPGTEDLIRIVRRFGFIPPAMYLASQASASEPNAAEGFLEPVEGKPDTYRLPEGFSPAPDMYAERGIPVDQPTQEERAQREAAKFADFDVGSMQRLSAREQQLRDGGMNEHQAALQAAREHELNRPTISARYVRDSINPDYASDTPISPSEMLRQYVFNRAVSRVLEGEEGVNPDAEYKAAIQRITSPTIRGEPQDSTEAIAQEAQDFLLASLDAHAPEGQYSDRTGVPEQEFADMEKRMGGNANFAYPRRLQPNFDALRQYELFAAGTPAFEPQGTGGTILKTLGGIVFDEGDTRKQLMDMATLPTEVAQAKEAMTWYRGSQPRFSDDGYFSYRNPLNNDALYWRYSTTTPTGLMRGMHGDTSRRLGRWSAKTLPYTQDPTVGAKNFLGQIRSDTRRPVQIVREGLTPQQSWDMGQQANEYENKSDAWMSAQYAKKFGNYPTGFQDAFFNIGRNLGDALTIPDLAYSTVTGGAGGAFSGAGKAAAKQAARGATGALGRNVLEEAVQGSAYGLAAQGPLGGDPVSYVTTNMDSNPLAVDKDGRSVNPVSPNFSRTVDENSRKAIEQIEASARLYEQLRRGGR